MSRSVRSTSKRKTLRWGGTTRKKAADVLFGINSDNLTTSDRKKKCLLCTQTFNNTPHLKIYRSVCCKKLFHFCCIYGHATHRLGPTCPKCDAGYQNRLTKNEKVELYDNYPEEYYADQTQQVVIDGLYEIVEHADPDSKGPDMKCIKDLAQQTERISLSNLIDPNHEDDGYGTPRSDSRELNAWNPEDDFSEHALDSPFSSIRSSSSRTSIHSISSPSLSSSRSSSTSRHSRRSRASTGRITRRRSRSHSRRGRANSI
jgi:hypothetical protein